MPNKPWTAEQKKALSDKLKAMYADGTLKAKPHTEETKEYLRQVNTGRKWTQEAKDRLHATLERKKLERMAQNVLNSQPTQPTLLPVRVVPQVERVEEDTEGETVTLEEVAETTPPDPVYLEPDDVDALTPPEGEEDRIEEVLSTEGGEEETPAEVTAVVSIEKKRRSKRGVHATGR